MPRTTLGQKSRTGCTECKKRRVKCDEARPICGNCARLHRDCSYLLTTPHLWSSKHLHSELRDRYDAKRTNRAKVRPALGELELRQTGPMFSLEDMRLLHHFTSETASTLSDRPEVQDAWASTVVRLALTHTFLLQGILALSALHMASLDKQNKNRLSIVAASKQDTALRGYRLEVEDITDENCDAVFAFSFLAEYYIPASAGTAINPSATFMEDNFFDAIVDWLRLCQGTSDIYKRKGHRIKDGPLKPLLWNEFLAAKSDIPFLTNESHARAKSAHKLWYLRELLTSKDSEAAARENSVNHEALSILVDVCSRVQGDFKSLDRASQSHQQYLGAPKYLSLSFVWLFEIPVPFVELLERRQPVSLIIFAHFSLLFGNAAKLWWSGHIPAKIAKAVAAILPHGYQQWIEWPVREVVQAIT